MDRQDRNLEELLFEWKLIYENGGPQNCEAADGFLLNRLREEMMEAVGGNQGFSEKCKGQIPEKVDVAYMAREKEIRLYAVSVLEAVCLDGTYSRLTAWAESCGKRKKAPEIYRASAMVQRLANAVKVDDLLQMKCLARPEELHGQIRAGMECLQRIQKNSREREKRRLKKGQVAGQYSIYDLSV